MFVNRTGLLLIALFSIGLLSCQKDPQPCMKSTAVSLANGHLTDVSSLETYAPEFLDSLQAYPQLQVTRIQHQGSRFRMDCNVYHEHVRLFFASYNLLKDLESGSIHIVGSNQVAYPLNISLEPSVAWEDAVAVARKAMDFGENCLIYTLGVIEAEPPQSYRLIWFVAAEGNEARHVVLDAQTNTVVRKNTGVIE